MANREHLKILKQGIEAWNKWRAENIRIIPDLSGAGLSFANLRGADLKGAFLGNADLCDAELSRTSA
jgi:hypothetical protein